MSQEKSKQEIEEEQYETPLVKCSNCDTVVIVYKGRLFRTCFCGPDGPITITSEGLRRGFNV